MFQVQACSFGLFQSLFAEHAIQFAIVGGNLAQRLHIAVVEQLLNARGVIHRLVLKGRQAVVEHGVRDVQIAIVELSPAQFVVKQFQVGSALLLLHETLIESVAIVQQIIGRHDGNEQQYKQDDGDGLIGLRLLHGGAVFAQRVVGRHLLEQLGINLVVIAIKLPLVQGQSGHSALVTNVENDVVIGLQTIVEPLNLWWHQREVSQRSHQIFSVGHLLKIMLVEIVTAQIGKLKCLLVFAIDIAEISTIGVDAGHAEGIDGGWVLGDG